MSSMPQLSGIDDDYDAAGVMLAIHPHQHFPVLNPYTVIIRREI